LTCTIFRPKIRLWRCRCGARELSIRYRLLCKFRSTLRHLLPVFLFPVATPACRQLPRRIAPARL